VAVSDSPSQRKQPDRERERQALELLRAHRQTSGYVPWPSDDNERLRALDQQRKQQQQAETEYQAGLAAYQRRTVPCRPLWQSLAGVLPKLA